MPPTQLISTLHAFRRRIKLLSISFGVGITLAAAIALLFATVLLDYLLDFPPVPRILLILISVGCVAIAFFTYILQPALSKLSLSDVAGHLESAFPQFDDRLRSTVAILTGNVPGSDAMKQRVLSETGNIAATSNFNQALVLRPVYQSVGLALLALAACVLITAITPNYSRIAWARLTHPLAANPWPKSVEIAIPSDFPTRVPAGSRIPLRISLLKGDRSWIKPIVYYQYDDGPIEQEYMPREGSAAAFVSSLDARAGTLKIRVKAGDDERVLPPITVVPRLAIKTVEADITPPPYTKLPPQKFNLSSAPATATYGSQITLHVAFNKPLAPNSNIQAISTGDDGKPLNVTFANSAGTFAADQSVRFRLQATDTDGFHNTALEEYEILVKPDTMPIVQIENPSRNEERTAVATIPLQAMAEDDYAIATMNLQVTRLTDKRHWSIPLIKDSAPASNSIAWTPLEASADRHRFRATYTWDLAQLANDLKPGDVLEYFLVAQDNFNLNGKFHQPVTTSHLRITIVSQDELAAHLTDQLRNLATQLTEVAKNHGRTADETSALANDTKNKPKLDDGDRAVAERLTSQESSAASTTKQIAEKLSDLLNQMDENKSNANELRSIAQDSHDLLDSTAEHPMRDAVASLSTARDPQRSQNDRNADFKKTTDNEQVTTDNLRKAIDRMGNLGNLREAVEALKALLKDQQNLSAKSTSEARDMLGKKPEDLSADERGKLDKNAQSQKSLAERTDKALQEMEKVAESMNKTDPTSAEALKSASQTGQEQQVSANQSRASDAISKNQQAQAQQSQKQAEAGIQAMLDKLREAEKRKLAELSEKLAGLQEQIANLIRRQATHNLDNVMLQKRKIDDKTLTDLKELAQNGGAQSTTPEQLSPPQEQTERNTRDISKMAEDLPNASDVGSALVRAAGKMERAIVSLRAIKLAEAYEPPQVDALSILIDSKKRVDQLKAEIDKQLNQNQKETLKQAYIAIRNDQDKINKETSHIDAEHKHYSRVDEIRLHQLSAEQAGLSGKVADLEEDLKTLGGTVYVWANRDLVTGMTGVKDQLAKPATGSPTQIEEARILDQLDAMIRSLDVKPLTREFEQRSSGGGGVCRKKLPTEAELRLLKDLQIAINKATKAQDKPDKDKPAVLSLGTREGELRGLLDSLLQKASGGKIKLGNEPDPKNRLPEEAKPEDLTNQETDQSLLTDKDDNAATEHVDKETGLVGDRMGRIRQRLALDTDPGKVTQMIQEKVLGDLDVLIEQARKQEAQPGQSNKPQLAKKNGPKPREIGNKQAQAANQGQKSGPKSGGGASPASTDNPGSPMTTLDVSQDIKSNMKEWGGLTPRQRDAVIEGAGDTIIEKYKTLTDEYYKSLATKATEK